MGSRRSSRIVAYKIISQRRIIGTNAQGEEYLLKQSRLEGKYLDYALRLVDVATTHKVHIQKIILKNPDTKKHFFHSVRALCLLAVAELLYFNDTPTKVTINEWLEICNSFVGQKHKTYCNGVLDRVLKSEPILQNAEHG